MKILVIRFSSIGDIVLTTPVVRAIKKKYPSAELHYLIKKIFKPVLNQNPYIDKIHIYEESPVLNLQKENFDLVIDLQNNLRSRLVTFKMGVKNKKVNKINIRKWLMVNFKINVLPEKHIVERYFDTLKHLNVYPDGEGLDYYIAPEEEVSIDLFPNGFRNGFVAFAIGGAHFTKKLPPEKIAEFARSIPYPVLFIGGEEDKEIAISAIGFTQKEKLTNNKVEYPIFYNGCGIYSINQSASIIKQSQFVITHDTGMMHIAAAFQKKIISIWGNTIPAFGMYPYKTPFLTIENNVLPCRPCTKIGYSHCPVGHFRCMMELKYDSPEINKFLESTRKPEMNF